MLDHFGYPKLAELIEKLNSYDLVEIENFHLFKNLLESQNNSRNKDKQDMLEMRFAEVFKQAS